MQFIKSYWTPEYFVDRAKFSVWQSVHSDWPWLNSKAVRFLELWLNPGDQVFEWGSGRSTVWIASRVHSIVSVEHDQKWFDVVLRKAQARQIANLDLRLRLPGDTEQSRSDYVSAINEIDQQFDLIVVDGLKRDSCALAGITRLKPGGLILVDDINGFIPLSRSTRCPTTRSIEDGPASPEWATFSKIVENWRVLWSTNGLKDTAIWVKPQFQS